MYIDLEQTEFAVLSDRAKALVLLTAANAGQHQPFCMDITHEAACPVNFNATPCICETPHVAVHSTVEQVRLSAVQADHASGCIQQASGAFFIPPPQIDQYWEQIDRILKQAESWTQIVSAAEIREQLDTNRMLAWGAFDSAGQFCLVIARLNDCARGTICTAWLILPLCADDDAPFCALLNAVETFARFRGAAVLELFTAPWLALKVQDNLKRAKITAAILEVDLREPGRTN